MRSALQQNLAQHYKASHEFELQRIDKIRDRVTFVVGFLTMIAGIIVYLVSGFPHSTDTARVLLFYGPLLIVAALFVWATCLVSWVVAAGHEYHSLPDNPVLEDYATELSDWGDQEGKSDEELLEKLKLGMSNTYRDVGHRNYTVNHHRVTRLTFATRLAIYAFIPIALMLPSYVYENSKKPKEPTLVQLVPPTKTEPKQTNMGNQSSTNQQSGNTTQGQSQKPAPKAEPTFPKPNVVQESITKMDAKPTTKKP